MIYYALSRWDKRNADLRKALKEKDTEWLNNCSYKDLVKLVFDVIFNEQHIMYPSFDTENITEIDNGDYQGTLLYLIPFDTYQPSESEYLMTYVGYGSCSCCDTLQGIQYSINENDKHINDFMTLCRDIVSHVIRPYNTGWREDAIFNTVEVREK